MYFVYIIQSLRSDYSYIGIAGDIKDRFRRHNAGYEKSTKAQRPFKLMFLGIVASVKVALQWEKLLKSGFVKERIRNII